MRWGCGVIFSGGGWRRRSKAATSGYATSGYGDRRQRQWQRQRHLRWQWRQTATVVMAGYGGEGTSSGSRANVCFFVSVPCTYKNMVSLLPLALPPQRLQQHNKICAGGRARPRIMDCARFCAAQPLRPLYFICFYWLLPQNDGVKVACWQCSYSKGLVIQPGQTGTCHLEHLE